MKKIFIYSSFIIASLIVVVAFMTATSYSQLAIAVVLYVALAYFGFNVFRRTRWKAPTIASIFPAKVDLRLRIEKDKAKRESVDIADIDKRTFLKIIGAAGFSFFVLSILGRRLEALLFDRAVARIPNTLQNPAASEAEVAGPVLMNGYRISDIDEDIISYYGFINKDGAWMIMREDTETNSFRYTKGDAGFSANWAGRQRLKYDYFHKLF
ncbi:hypothetical protein HYV22_02360 [Candidatus Gottesmanbacteria bacterium]|nr:hypothetical protein [Candidatus Gottesmanbacteria bacterium]